MKFLVLLFLLGTATAGNPSTRPARTAPRSSSVASAPAVLRKFNLAPLWLVSAKPAEAQTMLGCMGPQYRPFDLVYEKVMRDSKNPAVYHVQGKSRERERLLPFSGTITVVALKKVTYGNSALASKAPAHYQATGRFRLTESAQQEGAGTFTGTFTTTFSHTPEGLSYMPGRPYWWTEGPAGEGSTFTSTWTSAMHPQPVKLVWASNFMNIVDSVISGFSVGERGPGITRKYARVGWSRYWENDEWWVEAEGPVL
ncbi:hypothetical protein [Hymenobacter metallicola]|uniref:Uncharacterized protein n=1 Tax=Hymenobacter metallicola TaxID=2563114 RepID=A0A4Z0QE40_9BACT|nr:hypothetical protein [Hymenobacter metallicola]TGE28320.1 hypothetical protein E5K02_02315 [Hymenobacter metallicola]